MCRSHGFQFREHSGKSKEQRRERLISTLQSHFRGIHGWKIWFLSHLIHIWDNAYDIQVYFLIILHWKFDPIEMYILSWIWENLKCKIRQKYDFVEISSYVEISDRLKFAGFWKSMHQALKRCISFLLIITGKKTTHFLLSTRKMLVW